MNWRMKLSWIVLVAGGLWGKAVAESNATLGSPLEVALLFAYVLWSLYWGAPAAWYWWRKGYGSRIVQDVGNKLPEGFLRKAAAVSILMTGGSLYCVFGGGIRQFFRHQRKLRQGA